MLTVYVNSDTPFIVPEIWLAVCRTCQLRRFPDDYTGDSSDECKKDSTDESKKDKNDDGDGRGSKHKITKRKRVWRIHWAGMKQFLSCGFWERKLAKTCRRGLLC